MEGTLTSSAKFIAKLDTILRELLDATSASRTTIRMDVPNMGFYVDDVVTEALSPGALSLKGVTSIDQRQAPTVKWLERERRVLVQNDFASGDPAPPPALIEIYGAKAQMLGPVICKDDMIGWISVHYTDGPREWQGKDIEALETAMNLVRQELRAIDAGISM